MCSYLKIQSIIIYYRNMTSEIESFQGFLPLREYSCHEICPQMVEKVLKTLESSDSEGQEIEIIPSVLAFKNFVETSPIIKMYLQKGLDSIPETIHEKYVDQGKIILAKPRSGVLHGYSINQLFEALNHVAQTPPSYQNQDMVGLPFYAVLVDLVNTSYGQMFFSNKEVNVYLKAVLDDYGLMLKTEKSLRYFTDEEDGWLCPSGRKRINYDDFVCDTSKPYFGFDSWNSWFTRALKPNARPVDPNPDVIVHNSEAFPLTSTTVPYYGVNESDLFWLKNGRYSLMQMFAAAEHGLQGIIRESFVGGTVYQGFLNPWCYHRWHSPVSGIIEKAYEIKGTYFFSNPSLDLSFADNYINSQPFLSMVSTRQVYIIKADNQKIGRVGVIEIGMIEVSGCRNMVKEGQHVEKGELLGMFEFGGSSHALVFDRKAKLTFNDSIFQRKIDQKSGFEVSLLQKVNSPLATVN